MHKMKITSIIISFLCGSTIGAAKRSTNTANLGSGVHDPHFHEEFGDLIISMVPTVRKTIMQDESTFYDVILSGARTLPEVNAFLRKRDPYFVALSKDEFDTMIAQWLFQMLAK